MTSRLLIQLVLLLLCVTCQAQLPPLGSTAPQGIQDEKGRYITDERGRHILPDKPLGDREGPYLYYSMLNGAVTTTNAILDVSGNSRFGWTGSALTAQTSAGFITYGCTNTAHPNSIDNPFITYFLGSDASDFPSRWTFRFWVAIDGWDYAANYYSGSGAFGVVPLLAFKYGSATAKKVGVGAWNLAPATNISLYLSTNTFFSADVATSHPIQVTNAPGTNLLLHTWYHLVLTWDGSTVTLYCQGQAVASAVKDASGSASFDFGEDQLFSGRYDEIGVWNDRCWTAAQVLSDYNSGAGRTFP